MVQHRVVRLTSEGEQIVFFNCFTLYHKSPDSGERQYKSRTWKRRFGSALRAVGRRIAFSWPLASEYGTYKTVKARFWPWLSAIKSSSCPLFARKRRGGLGSGKGNSNSHGARPVHLIITMIKWIRTTRLSIKNSLSSGSGLSVRASPGANRAKEANLRIRKYTR